MTEVETAPNGHPPAAEAIAAALGECNVGLVRRVVAVLGPERAQALQADTLAAEADGGLLTSLGDRRRTPGGVFFKLAKEAATTVERRRIWPPGTGAEPQKKVARPVITWAEAVQVVKEAKAKAGEAKVKLTLVGRPGKVVQKPTYVMITLAGAPPSSMPAGLPVAPEGSAITWAVFIARKQWDKASVNLATMPDDKLVIDGYPVIQGGVTVLLAQSCKSMLADRAAKQAQKAARP